MDDEMDDYEVIDTIVWVEPRQADREELPCSYCCGAEPVPYERLRAEPHDACLTMVAEYYEETRGLV